MEQNLILTTRDYDSYLKLNEGDNVLSNGDAYRQLVGRLLYLTMT